MKNFTEMTKGLLESVRTDAKALVNSLKKEGKREEEIIRTIGKKFPSLSSIEILALMESVTKIPVTGNLVLVKESNMVSCEKDIILIPDSSSLSRFYVEGEVEYSFLPILESNVDLRRKTHCEMCNSDEHFVEDCDNLLEVCKTHEKKILRYCFGLKSKINEQFTNVDVLNMMIEMNKAKKIRNQKTFEFKSQIYSIEKINEIVREFNEDLSAKEVYGYCSGKIYEVINGKYPENCEYIRLYNFSRG